MKKSSDTNTYACSDGTRLSKANIDGNIRVAKFNFIDKVNQDEKVYCWACGRAGERLSISHIISVNKCQNASKSELTWSHDNMQMECIRCHLETENRKFEKHRNRKYKEKFIQENQL